MAQPAVISEPIRQATTVRSDRAHTFEVFVRRIGDWWPRRPLSIGGERVAAVRFEEELGGRVYEVWDDGTERDWGRVIAWQPPERFAITWEIMPTVTEVEVRFLDLGPALTRVELEHRGLDRLGPEELAACGMGGDYVKGWILVLERLERFAARAADPDLRSRRNGR